MAAPAISLTNVSKLYKRYGGRQFATLKSALLSGDLVKKLRPEETFQALKDVSFDVVKGQTMGVIGRNGSGKSTALKLIAGITKPTAGVVAVKGRISALIELGAGFHPEISGRENVFINGIMLGMSKREIQQRFDEIVEFAELTEFIDAPVKTYSSGMYMRLGFAVAIHVDPDILLVDEVLAVGDEGFTHKCLDKFGEFKRRNKTILLVTHSLGLVERFCDEAVWLDHGEKRAQGDPTRVVGAYMTDVERQEEQLLAAGDAKAKVEVGESTAPATPTGPVDAGEIAADMSRATEGRWGSGGVEISQVTLQNDHGETTHIFHTGEPVVVRLSVRAAKPVKDFVFGVAIFNAEGVCVYGTNTDIEDHQSDNLDGAAEIALVIDALDLVEGTYKLDVAAHKLDGAPYDYHRLLYTFRMKSRVKDVGIYRPKHSWKFDGGVKFRLKT
ncbi:MAG TPA: ABC transporter ATP-binding protein [Vicinamibacterales bacterium]|nr:ABC transporter ATP-binding protein [Vicinamibacterales bacterium]